MKDPKKPFITKQHESLRRFFKVIGPILVLIGIFLMVKGVAPLFSPMSFGPEPNTFYLAFIGMPITFVGFFLSGLGYGGKLAKYQAREYTPVAKDSFNYFTKESQEGIRNLSTAMREGNETGYTCPNCGATHQPDSKYCTQCGKPLYKSCTSCNETNTRDAIYCDNCGSSL